MFQSLHRLVNIIGVNLESAIRMATSIPANLMRGGGSDRPMIIGMDAHDLLLLDPGFDDFSPLSRYLGTEITEDRADIE